MSLPNLAVVDFQPPPSYFTDTAQVPRSRPANMSATIQDFPPELVIQTLAHLDHIQILRCAAVRSLSRFPFRAKHSPRVI